MLALFPASGVLACCPAGPLLLLSPVGWSLKLGNDTRIGWSDSEGSITFTAGPGAVASTQDAGNRTAATDSKQASEKGQFGEGKTLRSPPPSLLFLVLLLPQKQPYNKVDRYASRRSVCAGIWNERRPQLTNSHS